MQRSVWGRFLELVFKQTTAFSLSFPKTFLSTTITIEDPFKSNQLLLKRLRFSFYFQLMHNRTICFHFQGIEKIFIFQSWRLKFQDFCSRVSVLYSTKLFIINFGGKFKKIQFVSDSISLEGSSRIESFPALMQRTNFRSKLRVLNPWTVAPVEFQVSRIVRLLRMRIFQITLLPNYLQNCLSFGFI